MRSTQMDLNPLGPKKCICQWGKGEFVCANDMDAEDGLCAGCREDLTCMDERIRLHRTKENA